MSQFEQLETKVQDLYSDLTHLKEPQQSIQKDFLQLKNSLFQTAKESS